MVIEQYLTDVDWLTVVRGNDMPCNPLFYSFLVLLPEESVLFVEESRLSWHVLPSRMHLT